MAGQSLLQHSDKISLSLSFGKTPPSLGPVASHRRLQIFAQLARRPLIYSVKNWSRDLREKNKHAVLQPPTCLPDLEMLCDAWGNGPFGPQSNPVHEQALDHTEKPRLCPPSAYTALLRIDNTRAYAEHANCPGRPTSSSLKRPSMQSTQGSSETGRPPSSRGWSCRYMMSCRATSSPSM